MTFVHGTLDGRKFELTSRTFFTSILGVEIGVSWGAFDALASNSRKRERDFLLISAINTVKESSQNQSDVLLTSRRSMNNKLGLF